MSHTNAKSRPKAPMQAELKGDGTQFFRVSLQYFDKEALGGVRRPARILLKYMSMFVFGKGWKGNFSRRQLAGCFEREKGVRGSKPRKIPGSTLYREACDRGLAELGGAELIRCTHKSLWRGPSSGTLKPGGSEWAVDPVLLNNEVGVPFQTAPYKLGWVECFSAGELYALEFFHLLAYRENSLALELPLDKGGGGLGAEAGLSYGTLYRARKLFTELAILIPRGEPRTKTKDLFFLNPVLYWVPAQMELDRFAAARAAWSTFIEDQKRAGSEDQKRAGRQLSLDQKRAGFGSLTGRWVYSSPREKDQKRAETYVTSFLPTFDSMHQFEGEPARDEGNGRSPNGQDQKPETKGVALTVDDFTSLVSGMKWAMSEHDGRRLTSEQFNKFTSELTERFGRQSFPKKKNQLVEGEEQQPCPA